MSVWNFCHPYKLYTFNGRKSGPIQSALQNSLPDLSSTSYRRINEIRSSCRILSTASTAKSYCRLSTCARAQEREKKGIVYRCGHPKVQQLPALTSTYAECQAPVSLLGSAQDMLWVHSSWSSCQVRMCHSVLLRDMI